MHKYIQTYIHTYQAISLEMSPSPPHPFQLLRELLGNTAQVRAVSKSEISLKHVRSQVENLLSFHLLWM